MADYSGYLSGRDDPGCSRRAGVRRVPSEMPREARARRQERRARLRRATRLATPTDHRAATPGDLPSADHRAPLRIVSTLEVGSGAAAPWLSRCKRLMRQRPSSPVARRSKRLGHPAMCLQPTREPAIPGLRFGPEGRRTRQLLPPESRGEPTRAPRTAPTVRTPGLRVQSSSSVRVSRWRGCRRCPP